MCPKGFRRGGRRELEGTQEALEESGEASIHYPRCEKGFTCLERAVTCIPGGRRDPVESYIMAQPLVTPAPCLYLPCVAYILATVPSDRRGRKQSQHKQPSKWFHQHMGEQPWRVGPDTSELGVSEGQRWGAKGSVRLWTPVWWSQLSVT